MKNASNRGFVSYAPFCQVGAAERCVARACHTNSQTQNTNPSFESHSQAQNSQDDVWNGHFLFAHNCGTVRGKSSLQEGASVARSHFRLGVGGDVGVWIEVEVRGIGLRSVLKQQVRTRDSFCSCKLLPFQLWLPSSGIRVTQKRRLV